MKSISSLLSPPPSPHPTPVPMSSPSYPLTGCPELDLSVTLSPAPKAAHTQVKPRPGKTGQRADQAQVKPLRLTGRKGNTQVGFKEPVVVMVTPKLCMQLNRDNSPQQPTRGQSRSGGHHHASKLWAEPPDATSTQDPGCLERAELNTTLALKAELHSLQKAQFDSQKAIEETLRSSERTKNLISSRATEVVNVSRSQLLFTSLVSIDVQKEQLISQALQDRLLLAPPSHCLNNKPVDGPSLLPFMTSDLIREKPLSPIEEPVNVKLRPSPRRAHTVFDLYRRWRRCDAAP